MPGKECSIVFWVWCHSKVGEGPIVPPTREDKGIKVVGVVGKKRVAQFPVGFAPLSHCYRLDVAALNTLSHAAHCGQRHTINCGP